MYASRTEIRNKRQSHIHMHRLIMNAPKGVGIDHINGIGLDNRKQNLRFCTIEENSRNRKISKNNTTGYKGVFLLKSAKGKNRWFARIHYKKKIVHLGMFDAPEKAAIAYNAKAKELYKEFARLNVI